MRILGLGHKMSGVTLHRVTFPLAFMNDIKATVTDIPSIELLEEGWDIIFYNRLSPLDKDWEEVRKQMTSKIVMDIDDDWVLPANHLNYYDYLERKPIIENNFKYADLITCTNENIAERVYPFNKNIQIFPNALPYGHHQFTDVKREDERVRIFWAGGVTHQHDLEILKYPLQRLKPLANKIKMVLGGYNDTDPITKYLWDQMFNSFTCNGQLPYTKLHSLEPINYMQHYEWADIMLVPLENSRWHSCKSNLKLLEAASKKVPVICSKVQPYTLDMSAPVLWVEKQSDWFKHIKDLILNPNKRIEYGEKIHEWATTNYNLFEINKGRKQAFDNLVKS
jgi:glycosyltransferase involved in cell wall biosynthesis